MQLSDAPFDDEFPERRDADEDLVLQIQDLRKRRFAQPRRIIERPKQRVRVEQKPQPGSPRPSMASMMSSGVSSKSGAIQI